MTLKPLMEKSKNPILIKVFIITFLVIVFMFPIQMIQNLVRERESYNNSAEWDIVQSIGGAQEISGPIMMIPYKYDENSTRYAYFLPERLNIDGTVDTEMKHRGIYYVPVYKGDFSVQGSFEYPDFDALNETKIEKILWDQAELLIGFNDLRGIREEIVINYNGRDYYPETKAVQIGQFSHTISCKIPGNELIQNNSESAPFSYSLNLMGGKNLTFLPLGNKTDIKIHSTWDSLSFFGDYLPGDKTYSEAGVEATWHIEGLARNFSDKWTSVYSEFSKISYSGFGFSFFVPVDSYTKIERSVKYGLLFVIIPFIIFFLFEIFTRKRVHPIQYIMVGTANVIFYLLLLSFSEHLNFDIAYFLSSGATAGLITFYSTFVLNSKRKGLVMLPVAFITYIFMYVILLSEDYALIIGSVGLFLVLAAIMVITRKIDWYSLGQGGDKPEVEK